LGQVLGIPVELFERPIPDGSHFEFGSDNPWHLDPVLEFSAAKPLGFGDRAHEKKMDVVIKRAGVAVSNYTVTVGAGGTIDLEGQTIDMDAYCNRNDVVCPYDVFPDTVRMTQPGNEQHLLYVDYTPKGPLAELKNVRLLGNVDSDNDFSIALGISGAGADVCGLLGISYATGHINSDNAAIDPKGVSLAGDIVTAYGGGCLLLGTSGGAGAGVEVELNIPFTGLRR
jgi:hypothetical protein